MKPSAPAAPHPAAAAVAAAACPPLRSVALPADVRGRLWLSPMPGRFERWGEFIAAAHRAGLTEIVCLTPLAEVERVSPRYAQAIAEDALPCAWRALPMDDFGVAQQAHYEAAVCELAARLRAGAVVLLHCAAGIGRTGTTASCVLKALGLDTRQALQRVRDAGSNPQSALQSGLIERF